MRGSISERERQKEKQKLMFPYRCDRKMCPGRFKYEAQLDYHRKCHNSDMLSKDKYICPECGFKTHLWSKFKSHMWGKHRVNQGCHECPICGQMVGGLWKLKEHMCTHTADRPVSCPVCGKSFKNDHQMTNHRKLMHEGGKKKKSSYIECICDICGKKLCGKRTLEVHKATIHEGIKPYKCRWCDYTAGRQTYLEIHERTHTGIEKIACSVSCFFLFCFSVLLLLVIRIDLVLYLMTIWFIAVLNDNLIYFSSTLNKLVSSCLYDPVIH